MFSHLVQCKNCNTTVANTPNKVCIKCGAQNWLKVKNNTYQIFCENCKTLVAKTPNKICINCKAKNWNANSKRKFSGFSLCSIALCIAMSVVLFYGLNKSVENQDYKSNYFSLGHVQFGMLSINQWKSKVSVILLKKIDDFELDGQNRSQIKALIEQGLKTTLREVKAIINRKKSDNWFGAIVISFVEEFAINLSDFERRIPYIAESIMTDLDNTQNQTKLKRLIKQKLIESLDKTIRDNDSSKLNSLLRSLNCSDQADCLAYLKWNMREAEGQLQYLISFILIIFLMISALAFYSKEVVSIYAFIYGSTCLLVGGITLPMIDIDARIEKFEFLFIGEPLAFYDQILFYQSKSILDVVILLFQNSSIDAILVAFLILIFSILFPFLKIVSSCVYINKPSISTNKVISFIIFKSAKWSMADVFVVAIFMAYIGFKSILQNQLGQLSEMNSNLEILTLDNTTFQFGFLMFMLFTIAGLFMPYFIKSKQ